MIKNIIRTLAGLIAVMGVVLIPATAFAAAGSGTASLSLSPSGGSYNNGSTFTVTVRETSSEPVAGIEADFTYDASALECLGVDGSGSAFVQQYQNSCGGGSVTIARTTQGTTVTGTQTVASISFKALKGSGTTSVKVANSSEIDNASVNNACDGTCAGGATLATFALVTPAPAPTGGQGGGNGGDASNNGGGSSSNSNSSNNSSSNSAASNNGTVATTETPAATNGDVKSDSDKKSTTTSNSDGAKKNTNATKNDRTVWPWVILVLLGAAAVMYGLRSRKDAPAENPEVVTDAKAKTAKKADKPETKPAKAKAAETAAVAAPVAAAKKSTAKNAAAKKPVQNRKKSGKKSGKEKPLGNL
jgi:hypothetical protein